MAKAKKLPSGQWRCLVYSHTEHGQRKYESFTAATRREAERLAAEYADGKTARPQDITVGDAITKYIDSKESVLSPSTIANYKKMRDNAFSGIEDVSIRKLDTPSMQIWISKYSEKHSPKTVANAHGLLISSIMMFNPEYRDLSKLPARKKPDLYTPTDDDIKRLLEHVSGKELELAILLAAFGPMRRGEICALTSDDIQGDIVTVSKSLVKDSSGNWIMKQPKTYAGYRTIEFPHFVIEKLQGIDGQIIKATPDQITNRFIRAIRYSKSPKFRFHDLRHYSASIMHALGMPDQYIMERGGWASDYTMKRVYRDTLPDKQKDFNDKVNEYFDFMENTKCNTKCNTKL